jgi:hypothetical protein
VSVLPRIWSFGALHGAPALWLMASHKQPVITCESHRCREFLEEVSQGFFTMFRNFFYRCCEVRCMHQRREDALPGQTAHHITL